MANKIKISQLTPKGSNLSATDLLEISELNGSSYVTKSITGQEIIDSVAPSAPQWGDITGDITSQNDLQLELDAKQDTLVSGTSIKTINSTSLLGSGDLAVQPTLVSGTNIKTVNGTTLLGSGDVGVGVTSVTGTAPISSSGGTTPAISIATANTTTTGALTSTDWNTFNGKQNTITLTTIGTSGTATLVGSTLNIPQYSGGSGGGVTALSATNPVFVSASTGAIDIAMSPANTSTNGFLYSSDWNIFNGKQDALVSGTNIKTINGSSVLGSGDLTISANGLKGVHNINGYFTATSQGISSALNASGTTNIGMTANQLYAYPFIPNKTITSVSLKINVTTLGVGVNCRILIYSDVNGLPTTKLYESANIDCSTIGIKTATTSFTFTAGTTYWLCVQSSGVFTLSGLGIAQLLPLFLTSSISSNPVTSFINTSTFGSAPNTFVINTTNNGTVPLVGIYLS